MEATVVIEPYKSNYETEVVDIISTIQQKEFQIPITIEEQKDLFSIEDFYQTGKGNFWVALFDGQVVGTISLLDIGNDQVALRKMFVKKEYRGAVYKTAIHLLNESKHWAREKGVREIYLGTTPQFLAAHRFYEKNEFKRIEQSELPERFPVLAVDKRFYKYRV